MADGEQARLVAWHHEMKSVHTRLRRALQLARDGLRGEGDPDAGRDLLLYCRGFCTALSRHHLGEDRTLFPAVAAQYPHLEPVLIKLRQDHSMIAYLLTALEQALDDGVGPAELDTHLDGIEAIMESHFRYEERELLTILAALELDADVPEALGPL